MSVKYTLLIVLSGLTATPGLAQTKDSLPATSGTLALLKTYRPWLQTDHAAGMGLHPARSIGQTIFGSSLEKGDFKRPQQPGSSKQLYFQSERYQSMKNSVLYGSFKFTQQWDDELKLSDVMDPYKGSPYIIADSLGGDWQKQLYELNLKAATMKIANDKLHLGIGAGYKAGSGSRQNDPRPLSTSNELSLTPSLVWNLNSGNHLGINGRYNSYKEETQLLVNSNGSAQNVYKLLGPGMYLKDIIPGFESYTRNYKGNTYGGDIQYEYAVNDLTWLVSGGIQWKSEDVTDGVTAPRAAGKLEETRYHIQTAILYQPATLIHSLRFNWEQYDRSGREYFQDFNSGLKYETIFSTVLTTSLTTSGRIIYELISPANKDDYNWVLTAGLGFNGLDNMYLYPRSRQIADRANYMLCARRNWSAHSGNNLEVAFNALYNSVIHAKSQNISMPSSNDYIARELFFPDQGYISSAFFQAGLTVQYAFAVPQVANTRFFIKGNGLLRQHTGKEQYGISGNRQQFGLSIGAIY